MIYLNTMTYLLRRFGQTLEVEVLSDGIAHTANGANQVTAQLFT
jgi:septal ring factor EnvC (AmiA/AmiB activator)